jgi:hypothetical protein
MCSSTAVLVAGVQGGSQPPCLAGCCTAASNWVDRGTSRPPRPRLLYSNGILLHLAVISGQKSTSGCCCFVSIMCSSIAVLVAGVQGGSQPPCLASCCILQPIGSSALLAGVQGGNQPPCLTCKRCSSSRSSSTAVMVAGVQGGSQPPCLAESGVAATKGVQMLVYYRQPVGFTWHFNFPNLPAFAMCLPRPYW